MTGGAALAVERLGWGVTGRPIIRDLTLHVSPGEFVGIIGPNGSGKSSLLRCIYRYHRPDAGSVRLDGAELWALSARDAARRIAVLPQEAPGAFGMTVAEMAALGRIPHLAPLAGESAADRRAVEQALALVELAGHADRGFDTLSGGEKQRALLARALAQAPRLLVLDEPTSHLDIRHQRDILRLVRGLGISVLASLHDLNQAAAYCDRLYLLSGGTVAASGTPAEVLTAPLIGQAFEIDCGVEPDPETGRITVRYAP